MKLLSTGKFLLLFLATGLTLADSDRMAHERLQPENAPPTLEQVSRLGYALGYDPSRRQPLWVAYRLRREDVERKLVERDDSFKLDLAVSNSPDKYDYSGSGYDRGHMAPARDMEYDIERMKDSFYMSNMSPQLPYINRVKWKGIEDFTRDAAIKFGEIYVITGPIFEGNEGSLPSKEKYIENENGNIPIPMAFYKVLFTKKHGGMMLSFKVDNDDYDHGYWAMTAPHRTSVIESLTGFRFFPDVDADECLGLRDVCDINMWWL